MFLLTVQRGFEQQWLSITFSKAIFLGNGVVAILAGLLGNTLVDALALGPVAPFDAASCFLTIGMFVILFSWTENYGDPSENKDLLTQFRGAAVAIASGRVLTIYYKILFLDDKLCMFNLMVDSGDCFYITHAFVLDSSCLLIVFSSFFQTFLRIAM